MRCLCSCVLLLRQEHGAVVEQVGIGVVSVDEENFGNVSASRSALEMDNDIERIGDVGFNRAIGEVHAALQNATGEPRQPLLSRVCVNRAKRSGVSGVQELQEIEGLAATDLPENDAVGAVAEGSLQ